MKPRRGSKPRHKFKFTLTVNHITFPKSITRRLSSSKFYILLSRADKSAQTKVGYISKTGKIEYNESISLEATLLKNRSSNLYISKHCRIVLRQIKNSSTSNPNAKIRESSVGSIKFDLVDYIDRIPSQQKLTFAKCALPDVFISFIIKSKELDINTYEMDNMSVTSANTIRVDSFWFDEKSLSHSKNGNGNASHYNGYIDSEGEEEGNSSDSVPIERKEVVRLTNDNLMEFGTNSRKDMAKFRIKHAMDVMANESDNGNDIYVQLERGKDRIETLEKEVKHFSDEERKWNKCMIEWEREKSNFEASTIELNFKYQQEKQKSKECKKELNELKLNMKMIGIEKGKIENKYNNLVASLSKDRNKLLVQLSEMQRDYDDLEESLVRQQNSFRDTGNILEMELDKKKRKYVKVINELKKYKQKCHGLDKENGKLNKKIEYLQQEVYKMKMTSENNKIEVVKNGEECNDSKGNKKRRNSSVMNAIKTFNSVNSTEQKGYKKKRRKSGKLKRKSVSGNMEEMGKENNNSVKGRKKSKEININGPVLKKMTATKLSSVRNMINKIEKEENIMIEQELLSPVVYSNEGNNKEMDGDDGSVLKEDEGGNNELKDVSNVIEIGRDISVSDIERKSSEENNINGKHKHVRSDQITDLGINFDELNGMKNSEYNLSEDEEDNLSELSHSGNHDIVQDVD